MINMIELREVATNSSTVAMILALVTEARADNAEANCKAQEGDRDRREHGSSITDDIHFSAQPLGMRVGHRRVQGEHLC